MTDHNKLVGAGMTTHGRCPACHASFDGGSIPEGQRGDYSPPHKWDRKIHVQLRDVWDGTLVFACPDCGFMWHRFSGEVVTRLHLVTREGVREP